MKFRFLLTALFMTCLTTFAQQPAPTYSFKVYAPDGPLTQGDRIQVKYVLDAPQYSISGFDGGMEGARVESVDMAKAESGRADLHRVIVSVVFRIAGCGNLKILPMSAKIGSETVQSESLVLEVRQNPEYGQEWEIARRFLASRDAPVGLTLEYKYGSNAICAFSDPVNDVFAMVVRKDYLPYMQNPVLAYGIGNPMWAGEDQARDNSVYHILSRYEAQLQLLRKRGEVYRALRPASYKPNPKGVRPLLSGIEYGQSYPYNQFFPKERFAGKDSSCLAGCGPVSLAQVLTYYKHSVQPQGSCVVTTKSGKRFRVDLPDFPVHWDGSDRDVASLMIDCAGSVGADMSPSATSSSLCDFKAALISNWDYSPECTWVHDYYDFNMLAMIYQELDAARPVIVADDNHLFVVDGYDGDFFHFNLGWEGYCNGYYRAIIVPSVQEKQLPFREILIGIKPLKEKDKVSASIDVRTPGTLSETLSADMQKRVVKLKVTGEINGEDLECLRSMAGAAYRMGDYEKGHGSLMELDLSGARIVGGSPYAYVLAGGTTIYGTAVRDGRSLQYSYRLSSISDSDWATIREWGIDRRDHMVLGRTSDGECYMIFLTEDDVVGPYMFSGCSNLRTLYLPKSAQTLRDDAFHNCRALEHVYNLPPEIAKNAFREARWLEK